VRIEAAFVKGTRVLYRLDVRLREPRLHAELAARGGRRLLVERDDSGRAWEYRYPGLLALGHPAGAAGPPELVGDLRYASPQLVADLFVERGRKAEAAERHDEAFAEYEKATRIDPGYAQGYLRTGMLHDARKDQRQALLHYTAAAQAAYPAALKADAHVRIGRLYFDQRQPELALQSLARALQENPSHARAHFLAGLTYHSLLRKPTEALTAYQKAVQARPDHGVAHYNMGLIYQDRRDLAAAAGAFRKAVEHLPADPQASRQLIAVTLDVGDFAGAEAEARRRLGVAATDATAMVALAMALSGQLPERHAVVAFFAEDARLKEALEWLDRAIAAGYNDRGTLEQSRHLQKVRDQGPLAFRKVLSRL
jgi:tetratricopeptide (TPR) repeat protein